jgi:hypothetical protein
LLFWNFVPSNRFRNAVPGRSTRKKALSLPIISSVKIKSYLNLINAMNMVTLLSEHEVQGQLDVNLLAGLKNIHHSCGILTINNKYHTTNIRARKYSILFMGNHYSKCTSEPRFNVTILLPDFRHTELAFIHYEMSMEVTLQGKTFASNPRSNF